MSWPWSETSFQLSPDNITALQAAIPPIHKTHTLGASYLYILYYSYSALQSNWQQYKNNAPTALGLQISLD